jgi:hypothetical protein
MAEAMTGDIRDMLTNSPRHTLTAMPTELSYHDEYLAFRAVSDLYAQGSRWSDCAKYSIHTMVQLKCFTLYGQTVSGGTAL